MTKDAKSMSQKELEAIRHIRNAIMHTGQAPSVRQLQMLLGYRSPRSASDILSRLMDRGFIRRRSDGRLQLLEQDESIRSIEEERQHAQTVDVPLVGRVACGLPILAEENIEAMVPVSIRLAPPSHRHFLLRAVGDSMDAAGINEGNLVLVRQQNHASNGDRVVALIDEEATIKLFTRSSEAVVLSPKSTNHRHRPIVLTEDFMIQGVVIASISTD